MPFKVEYIFNPIGFFKEFADRFWIGIKELRFRPDYLDLEEVRLNINNFWIDIQTILSKCGGSTFIADFTVFLQKSWLEITSLYIFRFALMIPRHIGNVFSSIIKIFILDFYGFGYLMGDFTRRLVRGYATTTA